MASYKHVLVGLDLSAESQQVVNRVKCLFDNSDTKISICHILEPLAFAYGGDIPVDLSEVQNQLQHQATEQLASIGNSLGVAPQNQHLVLGYPAQEMHTLAREYDVDLIVVGSHGRHGLALIFGSTSNSVLHGASCDVLAVKIVA